MKKIGLYILILIALVGIFVPNEKARAQSPDGQGTCFDSDDKPTTLNQAQCGLNSGTLTKKAYYWVPTGSSTPSNPLSAYDQCVKDKGSAASCQGLSGAPKTDPNKSAFEQEVESNICSMNPLSSGSFWPGCFIQGFYAIFYVIPGWILWVAAYFFNVLISITLSSTFFKMGFVSEAWGIVRDISNIFFILILLYVAIKIILDLGGHEAKKMIANVIIIALLINFSMFFTQIIIDSANIVALVFYNKVQVSTKDAQGKERPYQNTGSGEKDVAGGLVNAFNPTKLITENYLNQAKTTTVDVNGVETTVPATRVSPGILIGMLLITGVLMLFAAYCLIVVGLSFLGRMIELFVLIIFSPFAFMSFTVPKLAGADYIGWNSWFDRLIQVSFMAPIFMFFLYFIFKLVHADIFGGLKSGTTSRMIESILMIVLPALLILILLLKATEFAKKGSGKFGEMVTTGAKIAGGLAVGVAAGGTALVGRAAIGGTTAALSRREGAMAHGEYLRNLGKWKHGPKTTPPPIAPRANILDRLGGRINASQLKSGDISHARHEIDELKKKAGVEGLSDKQLSGVDKKNMEISFVKEKRSEVESEIRKGYDAKGREVKINEDDAKDAAGRYYTDANGNRINATGENDYKAQRRQKLVDDLKATPRAGDLDSSGELSDQGRKKVEDKLGQEFNEILRKAAQRIGRERYRELEHEAKEKVGVGNRLIARSTSGSYDPRNLANIKADRREGLGLRFGTALIAAVAMGIRLGFKEVPSADPKRDFLTEMRDILGNAMKIKLEVKSGGSHDESHKTSGGGHH